MNYLTKENGLLSWLLTGDHKRIAILYLISLTFFFFIGGALAGLIRLELLTPQSRSDGHRHLQQGVHHARRHHDLLLPGAVGAGHAGQFSYPA